jgi:hypothetical protein
MLSLYFPAYSLMSFLKVSFSELMSVLFPQVVLRDAIPNFV